MKKATGYGHETESMLLRVVYYPDRLSFDFIMLPQRSSSIMANALLKGSVVALGSTQSIE